MLLASRIQHLRVNKSFTSNSRSQLLQASAQDLVQLQAQASVLKQAQDLASADVSIDEKRAN
jgi:hypothetical protein